MQVYHFRRYEKVFPKLYLLEEKKIRKRLPGMKYLITHIGSSAVPNLAGKGIIDIMISCPKTNLLEIKDIMVKYGYFEGRSNDKERIYLKREEKINGRGRRFHLHLVPFNHLLWKKANAFRDYLICNPKIAKEYEILKKKALNRCENNGDKYMKFKDKFVKKYTGKALSKLS